MPGYGARYWAERTPPARRQTSPVLRGRHRADVVVIGGGLVGATAAYVLARAGLDVVLVEAARMAGGATASGLGALLPEPDASFLATEEAMGVRSARDAWQLARHGALDLAAALRRFRARCDLTPQSLLFTSPAGEPAQPLKREQTRRKQAGLGAPWLGARPATTAVGWPTTGAIRVRDGFAFDPVRATLALIKAAQTAGARVFEKSPVRRTTFSRTHAEVHTASGEIQTAGVFVATGHPGPVFRPLARHVRTQQGFVVVTQSLTAAMRREVGPRDGIIRETGVGGHWTRWLPEDRVLFGGALSEPVGPRQLERALVQRTGQLMYELSVRYPVVSGLPAHWGWDLPVVTTANGLPWIGPHRNYPFHFFALAFGWHADGLAWHAAKAALRHFQGVPSRDDRVFGFQR